MSVRWEASGNNRGQALLELAVFGSFLILIFGWIINRGLAYDYGQQATMEAFRRGLASAASQPLDGVPSPKSHQLLQDRHIPNPADLFALGSVTPVSAKGGVTRSYRIQTVPENDAELPRQDIRIENSTNPNCPNETCSYTTAGFRTEYNVPTTSFERYRVIYGEHNVCDEPECGGSKTGVCLRWGAEWNDITQQDEEKCLDFAQTVLVIFDACEGQIIDRETCTSQAAQIVDSKVCEGECQKTASSASCDEECKKPGSKECTECQQAQRTATRCEEICSHPMQVPSYAAGTIFSGGRWVAPSLETMFAGISAMGVQPGSTQTVATDNAIRKQETPTGIVSTTRIGLIETTERDIVTRLGGGTKTDTVTATRQEDSTATWNAPW